MHLKELNHRSPVRIFERSVHGGLGRGNLGVVAAAAGVGKRAFLTCIGLDHLLRGHSVLHAVTIATVDHVREFYEEMFNDLAHAAHLEEVLVARDQIEHRRIIQRLIGSPALVSSLKHAAGLLREHVAFKPDLIVLEGLDFESAPASETAALRAFAKESDCEVWLSVRTPRLRPGQDWHDIPESLQPHRENLSVIVRLQQSPEAVHVRLLKDHDNPELAELSLDLDPSTLLIKQT